MYPPEPKPQEITQMSILIEVVPGSSELQQAVAFVEEIEMKYGEDFWAAVGAIKELKGMHK